MNWIWIFIRITGLTAYVLLTLSVLAGIFRHIPRKKGPIIEFHQVIGQIALLGTGVHAYLLFYDHYQPYSLKDVLVPFLSQNDPVLTGIGTLSMYLLLVVIITSDFMKAVGRKTWKKIHYLVFPLWLMALIHGFFLGTESGTIWAKSLYGGSLLIVFGATVYLVIRKKKTISRPSAEKSIV
ncbi:ferric reductase-like transmembrane domain-containing protein [Falsibacillus pallidus]|uniref:ferric reductase-like transmembrane domain-containing protein n=1 Tax=Falsibacillus pallidus TaxID=493781 RepID=UPI003D96E5DA